MQLSLITIVTDHMKCFAVHFRNHFNFFAIFNRVVIVKSDSAITQFGLSHFVQDMIQSVQSGFALKNNRIVAIMIWHFEDKFETICSVYIFGLIKIDRINMAPWVIR